MQAKNLWMYVRWLAFAVDSCNLETLRRSNFSNNNNNINNNSDNNALGGDFKSGCSQTKRSDQISLL